MSRRNGFLVSFILCLVIASAGCLGGSDVGDVKVVVVGASVNVNVTAVVRDNATFNYTYNLVVEAHETTEMLVEDVPEGLYWVTVYYYGKLQEQRIIEVVGGESTKAKFTIYEDVEE